MTTIHLDRNHASPHATSNLMLDSTSPSDQHPVLSWSGSSRDDGPFYQESEQDLPPSLVGLAGNNTSPRSSPHSPATNVSYNSSASVPRIAPEQADTVGIEKQDPEPSTSSPVPAATTSPALQSSSSLTPPPDANSPVYPNPSFSLNSSGPAHSDGEGASGGPEIDEVGKGSRASTPLSELSSAPDGDEHTAGLSKDEDEVKGDVSTSTKHDSDSSRAIRDPTSPRTQLDDKFQSTNVIAKASISPTPLNSHPAENHPVHDFEASSGTEHVIGSENNRQHGEGKHNVLLLWAMSYRPVFLHRCFYDVVIETRP